MNKMVYMMAVLALLVPVASFAALDKACEAKIRLAAEQLDKVNFNLGDVHSGRHIDVNPGPGAASAIAVVEVSDHAKESSSIYEVMFAWAQDAASSSVLPRFGVELE